MIRKHQQKGDVDLDQKYYNFGIDLLIRSDSKAVYYNKFEENEGCLVNTF